MFTKVLRNESRKTSLACIRVTVNCSWQGLSEFHLQRGLQRVKKRLAKKMYVTWQTRGDTARYAAATQYREINNKNRDLNNFTIFTNNNNKNNKNIHQRDGQDCLERDERAYKPCLDFNQNISNGKVSLTSNIEGSSFVGHDSPTPRILCCWGSHSTCLQGKGTSHMPESVTKLSLWHSRVWHTHTQPLRQYIQTSAVLPFSW